MNISSITNFYPAQSLFRSEAASQVDPVQKAFTNATERLQKARDVLLRSTPDQIRSELASLEKRGLITVGKNQPLWWAELTAEGESVVEYRSDAPACIARPPRW